LDSTFLRFYYPFVQLREKAFALMNLELLDPFGRQIPDRVDSTLSMADPSFHFRRHELLEAHTVPPSKKGRAVLVDPEWQAAYHVAFNRRGTYLAVGYGSGAVGVHNVLSRTLSALYPNDDLPEVELDLEDTKRLGSSKNSQKAKHKSKNISNAQEASSKATTRRGVTSVSWSRRSRSLLVGAAGDATVRLWDTTHPYGSEECAHAIAAQVQDHTGGTNSTNTTSNNQTSATHVSSQNGGDDDASTEKRLSTSPHGRKERLSGLADDLPSAQHATEQSAATAFNDADDRYVLVQNTLALDILPVTENRTLPEQRWLPVDAIPTWSSNSRLCKSPAVSWSFDVPIGGSLQVHPRIRTCGLAALTDGTLVVFWMPANVWTHGKVVDDDREPSNDDQDAVPLYEQAKTLIIPLWDDTDEHFITCASFHPHRDRVYAATKEGTLLGWDIESLLQTLQSYTGVQSVTLPMVYPRFAIESNVSSAAAWYLLVSRNGKHIVVNCANGSLRLYATNECWETPDAVDKPHWVFQDVVNKVKFASCDLSGDGEFIVGGANGDDNKYEVYVWNTSTGALMDKLTGAGVSLYAVAWHPARTFLAVATSDGLVDMWGPRVNWTAFAPDFQALPSNVEYVEREDEFDVDTNGRFLADLDAKDQFDDDEASDVDVLTVARVPVFASDSEEESEVFTFPTRVRSGKWRVAKAATDD
jgi:WD40 repeat protein